MPRADAPGIGLHCFHYARLSRRRSLIVTKKMEAELHLPRKDCMVVEVDYRDRTITREKITPLDILVVGSTKIYGDLRLLVKTIATLRKQKIKPQAIHVHSANYLLSGAVLKLLYRVPLCLNFGGTELLRAKRIPYYRWMFKFLDAGFYVAREMEDDLRQVMDFEKCIHTANGIDHAKFFPNPEVEKQKLIVSVGNLRWQKDYGTLIDAFGNVAEDFPDYQLRIFGEGPQRQELEALIAKKGLEKRVFLEGMQSQETVRETLHHAEIFAMSSAAEGFPKALIEAMACGVAVACTDAGECRHILEGVCDVVPSGQSYALAQKLSGLMSSDILRHEMQRKAIARSREFSWEKVSAIVEGGYDRLGLS